MKLRLLTCAIVASLTGLTGVAMSATADSPYHTAVELTANPVNTSDYKLGVFQLQDQLNKGDGRAAVTLANLLLTKERQNQDSYPYAVELFRRAVDLGTAGSELQLAVTLMRQGLNLGANTPPGRTALAEARELFQKLAAESAAIEANWNLGFMETRGLPNNGEIGVSPTDFASGVNHIRIAADAGHSMAAYWMASYLDQIGQGSRAERLAYLRVAAEKNHTLAKQDLAKLDPKPAISTSVAAVAQGFVKQAWTSFTEDATDLVASLNVKDGVKVASLSSTPPSPATSTPSAPPPAQGAHDAAAAPVLATFSTTAAVASASAPLSSPADQFQQERDVLQAALAKTQLELNDARRQLATLSQDKIVLPSSLNQQGLTAVMENDYETALSKFREAAKFDYAPAIANLGLLYLNGTAVPQDGKQAIALFKRAASLGNVTAAENAGRAYDYGIGVYRSRYHAIEWYEKAVKMGSQHAAAAVARLKAEP